MINRVGILGRLGQDPEFNTTPGGKKVVNFSVATNESWIDKGTGEKQTRTEWHKIVAWGKLAELCRDYLHQGKQCYIEGKLRSHEYENKEGIKRYVTEIIAGNVIFLGDPKKKESNNEVA